MILRLDFYKFFLIHKWKTFIDLFATLFILLIDLELNNQRALFNWPNKYMQSPPPPICIKQSPPPTSALNKALSHPSTLTHFMSLVVFYIPGIIRNPMVSRVFTGYKETPETWNGFRQIVPLFLSPGKIQFKQIHITTFWQILKEWPQSEFQYTITIIKKLNIKNHNLKNNIKKYVTF